MNRYILLCFATFGVLLATPEGDYSNYSYNNYVMYSSASSDPKCSGNCAIVCAGIGGFILLVCICCCIKSCCKVCKCPTSNTNHMPQPTYQSGNSNDAYNTYNSGRTNSLQNDDYDAYNTSYNSYNSGRTDSLQNDLSYCEYDDYYV